MQLTRKRGLAVGSALAVAAALVIALLLAGGTAERRFDEGAPGALGGAPPPARKVGQAVRLRTTVTTIEVKPLSFVRFPSSAGAGPGIGVDLDLKNVGREPYRDQPMQAGTVTLRRGGEAERLYDPVKKCQGPPRDTVTIAPGRSRRYCLPFETGGARPERFLYAPEFGLPRRRGAPQAAAWSF